MDEWPLISAADSGSFNAVVMTNLLERLPAPAQCLENLVGKHGLVKPGGLLILSTTGSWSTSYTPKSQWLGGYKDEAGNEVRTLDGIKAVMAGLNGESRRILQVLLLCAFVPPNIFLFTRRAPADPS